MKAKYNTFRDPTPTDIPKFSNKNLNIRVKGQPVYGIDKLELVSKMSADELQDNIKILRPIPREMARHVKVVSFNELLDNPKQNKYKKYKNAFDKGYRSLVRISLPSFSFVELLIEEEYLLGQYKPWLIELYKDIQVASKVKAEEYCNEMISCAYKLYSHKSFLFDSDDPYRRTKKDIKFTTEKEFDECQWSKETQRKPNDDIFGKRTLYLGEVGFQFVIYARNSKNNGEPCVHVEWRLIGNDISKKLGIRKKNSSYMRSIKNLLGLNIAHTHERLTEEYIKYCRINELSVARHFRGWSDKKKFTRGNFVNLMLDYNTFQNVYNISTTSDLLKWCKENNVDYRRFFKEIDLIVP